jgi:16S rRNA G527 N7-methylase RsmG
MMFHVEHLDPEPPKAPFQELAEALGMPLSRVQLAQVRDYLRDLRRWNATTSLLQARSWDEVAQRHVGEGWAASLLLPPPGDHPLRVLDIGSGGGIPAIPLRIARPDVHLALVEPRTRKAAFLRAVTRVLPNPTPEVHALRLEDLAPGTWDVVTFRGIKLEPELVLPRLAAHGMVLRFPSQPDEVRSAWLASGLLPLRQQALPTPGLVVEAWGRPS